ncbi:MAG: hypothetical protein QW507_00595 [Candidatus Nanoarchaeia archaeon]|nr:hypothetical protein [Candidatus Haiyanarchaeum thermophilum]MCW1302919.1 hypothetical protein [Candidatus Haiyanarchaeum thermophilum]MCW1303598.1 hypothetical protein [Candidatus Haiyanarchaeum thermophilum]MCW1306280.1 hypothetical protein [Candidatus Haiyanarchaeum thermophilum]MCW1307483.1 hypothetical protein [Candidatus Haiyanarchaeum thermophilum]
MRSQLAVPIIILVMLGIILFFLIAVSPSVKREYLNLTTPTTAPKGKIISLAEELVIGGADGEEKWRKTFPEGFVLSRTTRNETLLQEKLSLSSNILSAIFGSPYKKYSITQIDENTREIHIKIKLIGKDSTPTVKLVLNNQNILEKSMEVGEEFYYKFEPIQATNELYVYCIFQGLALYQSCSYEVEIMRTQEFTYNPEKSLSFYLSRGDEAEILKIFVHTGEATGAFSLFIDEKKIMSVEKVTPYTQYNFSIYLSEIGLGEGRHILKLSAGDNSEIHVRAVTLVTLFGREMKREESFTFSLNKTELIQKKVKLLMRITDVEIPGTLWIHLLETNKHIYVASGRTLDLITIEFGKEDLVVGRNTLRLYAPSGKFRISDLKILIE